MFYTILSIIGSILFIAGMFLIFCNNKIYCYIFEHKNWKQWKAICKYLPLAKFEEHNSYEDCPYLENYKFFVQDENVIGEPVLIVYWVKQEVVSVHSLNDSCILSDFDKYHSDKARDIIKSMI